MDRLKNSILLGFYVHLSVQIEKSPVEFKLEKEPIKLFFYHDCKNLIVDFLKTLSDSSGNYSLGRKM